MFISYNTSTKAIIWIDDREWACRKRAKGLTTPDYWTWLDSVTKDGVPDYSGETNYSIVKTELDVDKFNRSGYITSNIDGIYFHLKWDTSKKEVVEDDDSKTAWEVAEQWVKIRAERDRLLAETDWMMLSDTGTVSTAWKNYRKALREIPSSQDSAKVFSDIDWPDKPSS